ncbi:MAG: TonB-dependent receptor [Kordiimonadaceae bacterium]|nr:TonB-dependent receptor [Kordiimonadaceae bacterium]
MGAGVTNVNSGTGVNLRGLGNDSTLVLLNGRRLAPAGVGNFVDISMIPLTAIERIEVLTDGASAIYGSDAVGGVVNFRLRTDYEGFETRVRYGSATSGDLDDIQLGQTFGTTWDTGHVLISYEYQKRDNLDANDRAFAEDQPDPTDLLPRQKRHSAFLTAGQSLSDTFDIFADIFYSKRNAHLRAAALVNAEDNQETEQYGASLGLVATLGANWQAELVGSFSRNDVLSHSSELFDFTSDHLSLEGKIDGSLFTLPGGDVKLAVGGQVRGESFKEVRESLPDPAIDADRTVYGLFGEIFVPLVGKENRMAGVERLEITVAGRYEDYSDFGSSTDSKLGLLWSPTAGINLRGTYGTSFRVPLFRELFGTQGGILVPLPDPSSTSGSTLSLVGAGANSGLQPEIATTWTAGFDIAPPSLPGLTIQATYFDIDFKNRIASPGIGFDALFNPRFEPVVDRNPDQALLAFLGSSPESFNLTGGVFDFTDAEVFIDNRFLNLSSVQTR